MAWPGVNRRPTGVEADEFIPQIWSSRVIQHVRENLVCVNLVNTSWKAELNVGDKIFIPTMIAITGAAVDPTITTVLPTGIITDWTGNEASITINIWWELPIIIDDSVKRQSQVGNLLEQGASNAAFGLEKKIDLDVNSFFSGLGGFTKGSTAYGSDGQTFTDDIMIYMNEYLDEEDVPRENRALAIDPSTLADIYKIDKFVRLDYQKVQVVATGNVGQMYGIPVYVTNNLTPTGTTGAFGCLLHKDAIGLVIQDGPTVEKWRHHGAHADVVTVSAMWGTDELRDTFGIPFYTRKA